MRVIEIAKIIDSWMPTSIAEDFDNVGLIIGDPESKITSILITLDTTEDVVEEAINKGCNLIVSYHPIIFNGLKQITNDSYVQKSVIKAVKNNIFGTLSLVRFAEKFNIDRFVLISTDKAVRPTNVMGATKRFCEMILQARAAVAEPMKDPIYSMVRFGNVLGSSGSVVPLFREQIDLGGPITLTSSEITRYFMSISEAAELVIQSASLANSGDLFVLDMGEPIKILELAKAMIRLSGRTIKDRQHPNGDIEIQITGLRPGEKLYEELLIGDNVIRSSHGKIMRAKEEFLDWKHLEAILNQLLVAQEENDKEAMLEIFSSHIQGFGTRVVR